MKTDDELQRIDTEHQRYLERMQITIRQRLTSRGCSEAEIEWHLATLPTEPIRVIVRRMMAMPISRIQPNRAT